MRHENNLINYATPPYPTTLRRDQNGSPVQGLLAPIGPSSLPPRSSPSAPSRVPSAFPHHDSHGHIDEPPFGNPVDCIGKTPR